MSAAGSPPRPGGRPFAPHDEEEEVEQAGLSQKSSSQVSESQDPPPVSSGAPAAVAVLPRLVPGGPPIRVSFSKSLQAKTLGPRVIVELGSMPSGRQAIDLRADSGTVGLFTCTKDSMKLDIKSDVFEGAYVATAGTVALLSLQQGGEARVDALADAVFRARFSHNALANLRGTVEGEVDPSKFTSELDRNVNLERGSRGAHLGSESEEEDEPARGGGRKAGAGKKRKKPSAKRKGATPKRKSTAGESSGGAKKKRKIG